MMRIMFDVGKRCRCQFDAFTVSIVMIIVCTGYRVIIIDCLHCLYCLHLSDKDTFLFFFFSLLLLPFLFFITYYFIEVFLFLSSETEKMVHGKHWLRL